MKIVKLGLFSAVFFFLLLTGISLLFPSSINISKAIDINAPSDSVFSYIKDMSKWKVWYPNYDSATVRLSGNTIGKGASLSYNKTKVVITEVDKKSIKAIWQSGDNNNLPGEINIISYDSSSLVTVQWLLIQKVKWYPWEKFSLLISNKTIGPFMEQGLENLKKVNEKP